MRPRVEVSFWFFAVLAVFLCFDRELAAMQMLAAIFLHEGGHLLAMRALRMPVQALRFMPFGIEVQRQPTLTSYRREAVVYLCGPLANLLLLLLSLPWCGGLTLFGAMNLVLFLFNLMPVAPLDGGNLLHCLLQNRWEAGRAATVGRAISGLFLLPMDFLAVYLLVTCHNITLLICCGYLSLQVVFGRKL